MPTLSATAPDPHRPGYRVIEVDRGRFASLREDALAGLPLVEGSELPAPVLDTLTRLAEEESAYRAAVRALAYRPHARFDLGRRLRQRQHPPAAVEAALSRLDAGGLLDDRRFAVHFAATRAARGRGPARLIRDLQAQGVDRRVAEAAVREAIGEEEIDVARLARAVATRRAAQLGSLPRTQKRRRLLTYLLRRGYDGPELRQVVDEVCRATA